MNLNKFDQYIKDQEKKNVDEADLKYERMMQKRIGKTSDKAQDAFWSIVAKEFKEAKSGDVDPWTVQQFDKACEEAVKHWVQSNVPRPEQKRS